jgi:hexosaminidase
MNINFIPYKLLILLILFATQTLVQTVYAQQLEQTCLNLMPCPHSLTLASGFVQLNKTPKVFVQGMSEARKNNVLSQIDLQLNRSNQTSFSGLVLVNDRSHADIEILVTTSIAKENRYNLPKLGDDESYQLTIAHKIGKGINEQAHISIKANSDFGVLHGLTTLVQVITTQAKNNGLIPKLTIQDKPRFPWRGLLIDSARHFMPISTIKRQIDGMAAAKLNVFHWHLTDDQGWRFESKRYPKLHQLASDKLFYSQDEIKDLIHYASLRGIRVVPELDVPGHASAIAVAYPELIAENKPYIMERQWGVFEPLLDVSNTKVYSFIDDLVGELTLLFPDNYIHIGGDEVNPKQWLNNENIQQLMKDNKLKTSDDVAHYFNVKVQAILTKHQRKMMGWDEIYHPDLSKDIVIQSWRGLESINRFAKRDYQGILSAGFYIDQPQYSSYHYRNDPVSTMDTYKLVSEEVNEANMTFDKSDHHRTWQLNIPRLKGSDVNGTFILAIKSNKAKVKSLNGYLKLNNNSYQKVTIITPEILKNREQVLDRKLVFTADTWMGPLRFELNLVSISSDESLGKPLTSSKNCVFIGNAFYQLNAKESNNYKLPNIALSPRLNAAQSKNILGAEATLWTEMVTPENIDLRTWPRLFAIAERLWSPQEFNNIDNMYQRLLFIDSYSENIIGLMHNDQMREGFSKTLGDNTSERNIDALVGLAESVEPAHYYTRHHIKYLQNKYHQLAPLESFVDFLPVESYALIELSNKIMAYKNGNTAVLPSIKFKLKAWQKNVEQLSSLVIENAKFSELTQLLNDVSESNKIATKIVERCISKKPFLENTATRLKTKLTELQEQQNESVLAAIPLFAQLMSSCQNKNKQRVNE